jgi:phosphoribosyl 1,2-cyclic phosphate phosphodiesterase
LFHLRWGQGPRLSVLTPPDSRGCADLYKHPGLLDFKRLQKFEPVVLGELTITPVPLIHSRVTYGYCFESAAGRVAYLTDTAGLPPNTERYLKSWSADVLVLDCTHPPQAQRPRNHNDLGVARAVRDAVAPKRTILTHIGHDLDAWMIQHPNARGDDMEIAHDGLCVAPAVGICPDAPARIAAQECRD